jgi:Zn-dependent protease with chaperone function
MHPLPPGPVRDRLVAFCRSQGFHSEIYSWPLFEGQVLTAGIMGIVPRLRFLLITPALLETLNEKEIDSVLAHEIGHVKHLHLILYLILFLGFSLLAGAVATPLPHLILSNELFYRVPAPICPWPRKTCWAYWPPPPAAVDAGLFPLCLWLFYPQFRTPSRCLRLPGPGHELAVDHLI